MTKAVYWEVRTFYFVTELHARGIIISLDVAEFEVILIYTSF